MDDGLRRIPVVSAGVDLLRRRAPRGRSRNLVLVFLGLLLLGRSRGPRALGVGELLGEDARQRLRLVVGLRRARPGVAEGAVERA